MTPTENASTSPVTSRDAGGGGLALWQVALLILVAVALFWPGQTTVPPVDRDETRFAQATVQMLETGDFIDIRLQEEPRYLQPVGIYWLQAAAVAALSEVEAREIWAHRVPSFLAAIAAVALTAWLGARMFGPRIGFLAGLLLAATVLLNVEARLAKTDAMLLVTILVAIIGLHRAYEARDEPGARLPWVWIALFWGAVGLGLLVKGPINPLVVGLTAGTLCLIERRVGWLLSLRPLVGLGIAVAIALPWYVAIYIVSEGGFFQRSAGQNFLGKLFEGEQGHGAPPGFHLLASAAAMWPSVLVLVLGLPRIWRARRDPRVRFCLAWALPTWILYELVATKLPHYVLPAYPALMLLAAWAVLAPMGDASSEEAGEDRQVPAWLIRSALVVWALAGVALAVGPLAITLVVDGVATWPPIVVAPLALVAIAVLGATLWRRPPLPAGLALPTLYALPAATFLAVSLNIHATFPAIQGIWFNQEVARLSGDLASCPDPQIATAPLDLESVVFLTETGTVIENMYSIEARLRAGPPCAVLFLEDAAAADLRARLADTQIVLSETGRRVAGLNFSNGRQVDLAIYRVE